MSRSAKYYAATMLKIIIIYVLEYLEEWLLLFV